MVESVTCECKSRIGFMQDPTESGEWWVCAGCSLPTRAYIEAAFTRASETAESVR